MASQRACQKTGGGVLKQRKTVFGEFTRFFLSNSKEEICMGAPMQIIITDQKIDFEKAVADALKKIITPLAETICEMERIHRKEYLT